ncbi:MAG: 50S ribosomal protein L10 [Nitrospirae bacterium]|nr:50S ribosomal protein L10 [Candidatus Troglogloeales bacterium]
MTRTEKEIVVEKLHQKFSLAKVSVLSDYSGMNVEEIREVKIALRKAKGEFNVVKNRLAIRAAQGTPLEKVVANFKGPVAITLGLSDPVPPMKALDTLFGQQKKLKMRVGVIENRVIDLAAFKQVAKLPGREVLLGQLVARMKSPLYGIRGALGEVLNKWARTLQAVLEVRQKTEE